jgi:hypothetical protein
MSAQLSVVILELLLLPSPTRISRFDVVRIALTNYVTPVGLGDTTGFSNWAVVVLEVESYLGQLSLATFFVLLIRNWIRS